MSDFDKKIYYFKESDYNIFYNKYNFWVFNKTAIILHCNICCYLFKGYSMIQT